MMTRAPPRRLAGLACLAVVLVAGPLSACDPFQEFCASSIECEGGNEADIEACTIVAEAAVERAAIYECVEELEALNECREAQSMCEDGLYTTADRCVDTSLTYNDCVAAAQEAISQ